MRFDADREEMFAFVKNWNQYRVVSGMAVADIRIIIEKCIAFLKIRMIFGHRGGLQVHAENMDRHRFRHGQHFVRRGDNGA